ncbi:GTP-binding protein [Candidatus Micrarchaeota archaeon]|nr:MAG: GTP-binding protein [Candidatus Micrarchaeota archaeon]
MPFRRFLNWLQNLFNGRQAVSLGFYGSPNAGKTTIANRISIDWLGEPVGLVSEIPHETRVVQKKEKVRMSVDGKSLNMNLLDMPGISTKVDYREFLPFGVSVKEARQRAKEATRGIIEAIKWLENVDAALVVMDSTEDPYTQVNITILGNLEAKKIPVIIVANKTDLPKSKPDRIREAFPQYPVIELSALKGKNMEMLYTEITKRIK